MYEARTQEKNRQKMMKTNDTCQFNKQINILKKRSYTSRQKFSNELSWKVSIVTKRDVRREYQDSLE